MTNVPRRALREIIAKYGTEICGDGKRCEGLLRDKCGSFRREISVLINALEEHVPLDLLAGKKTVPRDLLINRLVKRLEDNLAMTEDAALWAVESWALALNILTDAELAERENQRAKVRSENELQEIKQNFPPAAEPQKREPAFEEPTKQPPIFIPPTAPKASNLPINTKNAQPPAPTIPVGRNLPQSRQTQTPTPQTPPKKRPWRVRGCFVGCLLFLILAGILFVVVPYSIKVMRETQQQSPPQRPSQQ